MTRWICPNCGRFAIKTTRVPSGTLIKMTAECEVGHLFIIMWSIAT